MNVIDRLNRELSYNAWANWEAAKSLLAAQTVPERATAVMAHIIGAEWLWLKRLGHVTPPMDVWPTLPPAEYEQRLNELAMSWQEFRHSLLPTALERQVRYINTKGENWSNTVADVLTHVVLHSSYHRGQIATLLGRVGESAAYSDFIECVRRGYLDK